MGTGSFTAAPSALVAVSSPEGDFSDPGPLSLSWPPSSWPNLVAGTQTAAGDYDPLTFDTNIPPPAVALEHCAISFPYDGSWTNSNNTYAGIFENGGYKGCYVRNADVAYKLQTGGKAVPRRNNLWCISASATQWTPINEGAGSEPNVVFLSQPIDPQSIIIDGKSLNSHGKMWRLYADGDTQDVTVHVPNVDYFTFSLVPQKYLSYFDLYVQQANPGYSFYPTGEYDVGHAFWQFRTEAPNEAFKYISASLTNFLGKSWGFYPTNDPPPSLWNLLTVPGFVEDDSSHSHNIRRTFYIGFPDLLNGLDFTRGIYTAPPDWSATGFNCVSAARDAGYFGGVHALPWDMTPQNFGVTLVRMYPGPFEDDTDIFDSP